MDCSDNLSQGLGSQSDLLPRACEMNKILRIPLYYSDCCRTQRRAAPKTMRLLDMLNMPKAIVGTLVFVLAINSYLFFFHYLPNREAGLVALPTRIERTDPATTAERTGQTIIVDAPTASPRAAPTASPRAAPTASPRAAPRAAPTASPRAAP